MKYIENSKNQRSIWFIKLQNQVTWAKKARKNEITIILTMSKILAQSEAQTQQADNSNPTNRLPETLDPTRIFSLIRVRNSPTQSN